MFSFEFIKKVNQATDIYELVSQYVELVKSGKGYKGVCPFHEDKDPSFSVSPELNFAKCFSCGEGGSPIEFLSKIEKISLRDATIKLAKQANIPLEQDSLGIDEKLLPFYEIMDTVSKIYHGILTVTNEGKIALDYLNRRGITLSDIQKYKIGFAPQTNTVLNYLKINNLSFDTAITLGLIYKDKNGEYVDSFANRIIFPVTDLDGNIISFSGRSIKPNDNVKYLNLINSPLFQKHSSLYNLGNIKKGEKIYLVEGFFDAISHSKAGFTNTLATMGVALSDNHISVLKKLTNHITLIFDGDPTGRKTNIAQAEKLINKFKFLDVVDLFTDNNTKLDPDSLYNQNPPVYNTVIGQKTIDGYSYLYHYWLNNTILSNNNEVTSLIAKLEEVLRHAPDITKDQIQSDLSSKLGQTINFKFTSQKPKETVNAPAESKLITKNNSFYDKLISEKQKDILLIENQILKGLINPQFGYNLYEFYTQSSEEKFSHHFTKSGSLLYYLLKDYYKKQNVFNNDQIINFGKTTQYSINLEEIIEKIHSLNEKNNIVSFDTLCKAHDNYTAIIECSAKLITLFKKLKDIEDKKSKTDKIITANDTSLIRDEIRRTNQRIAKLRKDSK